MKKARSLGLDRFYVVPDYGNTQDGERIAALFGHLPLLDVYKRQGLSNP